MIDRRFVRIAGQLAALSLLASAAPALAQSPWLDRDRGNVLQFETLFPSPDLRTTFPSSAWFIDGRTRIAGPVWFVGEFAFAHVGFPPDEFEASQNAFGNPLLAVEFAPGTNGPRVGAAVRPWLSGQDGLALQYGESADLTRDEAFEDGGTTYALTAGWHHAPPASEGIGYDVGVTPASWNNSHFAPPQPNAHMVGYTGTVRYAHRSARIGVGLSGRWRANNGGAPFDQASQHQLDLAMDFLHGRLRPGLELLVPLDRERRQLAGETWGVSLAVTPH